MCLRLLICSVLPFSFISIVPNLVCITMIIIIIIIILLLKILKFILDSEHAYASLARVMAAESVLTRTRKLREKFAMYCQLPLTYYIANAAPGRHISNIVEDEYHFLCICPKYNIIAQRQEMEKKVVAIFAEYSQMNCEKKFVFLLQSVYYSFHCL